MVVVPLLDYWKVLTPGLCLAEMLCCSYYFSTWPTPQGCCDIKYWKRSTTVPLPRQTSSRVCFLDRGAVFVRGVWDLLRLL